MNFGFLKNVFSTMNYVKLLNTLILYIRDIEISYPYI